MITTSILGQVFGITFLIVSISILIHINNVKLLLEKIRKDQTLSWIYGYTAVLTGSVLLAFSNFSNNISSMISILGIVSLLKGILFLWFPKSSSNFELHITKNKNTTLIFSTICLLLISIILLISSF